MTNAFVKVLCVTLLCCAGCNSDSEDVVPINISGATSEKDLDEYLGKRVTFTGKWQNTKDTSISNGHISINPLVIFQSGDKRVGFESGAGFTIGSEETVIGYLHKDIVDYSGLLPRSPYMSNQPEGEYYYIEKGPPDHGSEVSRSPPRDNESETWRLCFQLAVAIRAYSSEYDVIPPGAASDIADALRGKNPKLIVFGGIPISPDSGPFLDSYGNPVAYDFSTPGAPSVISSGLDGIAGNDDDIKY